MTRKRHQKGHPDAERDVCAWNPFADIPDKIYAIRNVSPIIAGVGKDRREAFLASDVTALSEYVSEYFVVPEDTLTILEPGRITMLDKRMIR